jgi:hypothetical protein
MSEENKWDGKNRRESCACTKENEIDEMHASIKKLDVAIFGNGDIRKGLQWKIASNTEFIDGLKKAFWFIVVPAMLGAGSAVITLIVTVVKAFYGKHGI